MAQNTRLYLVTDKAGNKRLVDAATPSQAIRHVVGDNYTATVPGNRQVAELARGGIEIETAKKEAVEDAKPAAVAA